MRTHVIILGATCWLSACESRQQRSDCWAARQASRDAVAQGQLGQAAELLKQARGICGDNSVDDLRRIEGIIADRRDAARQLEQTEQTNPQNSNAPTQRFVQWATGPLEELESTLTAIDCAPHGTPEFGFCSAQRREQPSMKVRYWDTDHAAIRYSFESKVPFECEDLGKHRRVRKWSTGAQSYQLCEITEREARNLSALLLQNPPNHQMFIYSFEYLQKDPEFERLLRARK